MEKVQIVNASPEERGRSENSVHMQKRKITGMILIVFMLFGMCFENIKADSYFVCTPIENTNSYLMSADAVLTETQLCTNGMLGVRINAGMKQLTSRFISQSYFIYSDIFSLKEGKFSTGSRTIQSDYHCQGGLVTSFIHKSDGKKRI